MNQHDEPNASTLGYDEQMQASYKQAVERALQHLPVKNGVINIDAIWVETSIPYDILNQLLRREDLVLPGNVERINLKSSAKASDPPRPAKRRRRRRPKTKG